MPSEDQDRAAIVAEARTWLGTKYQHAQRMKGVACDCAGMPLETYATCGIIPETDVGPYSAQWHMHRSRELYLEWVEKFGREIPVADVKPGDFMVFRFGRTFSHGGIVIDSDGPTIIHGYVKAGMVTIDRVSDNQFLSNHEQRAFTFWGK